MKVVILGKASSVRIKNKNYRPFYNGESLMDIHIKKLINVLQPDDIYLSCEDETFRSVAQNWKINFILRDERYTRLTTSNVDVVHYVCKDVPGNGDILWTTPVEPLFDEYTNVLECWERIDKTKHDSLNVVYPQKRFILDQNYNPIGFGFGHWHKYSQDIPPIYQVSWSTAILSRACIEKVSYMIGARPFWYDCYSTVVDIDTEDDWEIAQLLYSKKIKEGYTNGNHRNL
ncbi:MAG: hypothetical protein FWE90_03825 [Defluviitaleaceae bacterium]|nr:hypothetical protein [Defluviitaleaceae bacterium]